MCKSVVAVCASQLVTSSKAAAAAGGDASLTSQMSNISISDVTVTSYPAEIEPPARDEQLAQIEIALLGTILAMALLGNGMMAGVLRRISVRRKLTRMNRMMAHLTVADIFVAVCHVLPQVDLITSVMLLHILTIVPIAWASFQSWRKPEWTLYLPQYPGEIRPTEITRFNKHPVSIPSTLPFFIPLFNPDSREILIGSGDH